MLILRHPGDERWEQSKIEAIRYRCMGVGMGMMGMGSASP